jgi:hypothetical protein
MLLVVGMCLIGGWSRPAYAQTPPACGCAFVNNRQPRNVKVEFAGDSRVVDAKVDMVVHTGDIIKVLHPVSGMLVCDNVQRMVVLSRTPRNQAVPCNNNPKEGILIGRNGRMIESTTMSDTTDTGFPVVLSPRSTKLFNARPLLRWTGVSNATSYKVTVRGNEGSWSTNVPAKPGAEIQEMVYPQACASDQNRDCAPSLQAGESYKLIIEANGRNSEEEDLPNLGFTVLTGEEAQKVRSRADEINRLALGEPLKTQMLASLYANKELNADAIATLEGVQISQRNPAVVRLLGNLYLKLGLTRRAEALYLNLLNANMVAQDTPAGRAITYQTLGEIYEALGNSQEAIKYYVEAASLYRSLKDQESANKIESRLSVLRTP